MHVISRHYHDSGERNLVHNHTAAKFSLRPTGFWGIIDYLVLSDRTNTSIVIHDNVKHRKSKLITHGMLPPGKSLSVILANNKIIGL